MAVEDLVFFKTTTGVAIDGSEIQGSQNETKRKNGVKRKTSANLVVQDLFQYQSTPRFFARIIELFAMPPMEVTQPAHQNKEANVANHWFFDVFCVKITSLSVWNASSLLPKGLCLCWHCMFAFQQQGWGKIQRIRWSKRGLFFYRSQEVSLPGSFSGKRKLETWA